MAKDEATHVAKKIIPHNFGPLPAPKDGQLKQDGQAATQPELAAEFGRHCSLWADTWV